MTEIPSVQQEEESLRCSSLPPRPHIPKCIWAGLDSSGEDDGGSDECCVFKGLILCVDEIDGHWIML